MLQLDKIDLAADPAANRYVKDEEVDVVFARSTGELISREGPNCYQAGDALITGSTGDRRECKADRWSVSRDRFDEKYQPVPPLGHGDDGRYRARPIPVLAKQIPEPFAIARRAGGDLLRGNAQDWLLQYAPGDYGIVENARFERVYRLRDRQDAPRKYVVSGEIDGCRKSFDSNHFPQQADVLNIVLDHITQGMVVVGPDYRTLAFNRHFEEMFQLPPGSVEVGIDFRDILKTWAKETGQDQQMLDYAIHQLDEPATFEFEFPQLIKGEPRWCLLTHNPLPGKGFVRTFTDITKRKALEGSLLKLSREDPLTGLFNRRTLMDFLEDELRRTQRYKHPLSILMLDIDHFKRINDQWGHPAGDEVIKTFAAQCQSMMRENDKMARWGGEEFVMMLPETGQTEAMLVADRIRRTTEKLSVETQHNRAAIAFTVSIGVTTTDNDNIETVIARADDAMYEAKKLGRNRVTCH